MNNIDKELAVFDPMAAVIEETKHKYDIVHDATTEDGYALIKAGIKDVGGIVKSIEAARKDKKKFYLDSGRALDARAKEVTAPFVTLLGPMKEEKKAEDDKVKLAKEKRLAELQSKVDNIRYCVEIAQGNTSIEISELLEKVNDIDPENGFYEMRSDAIQVRANVLQQLTTMLTEKLNYEESERARIKLEEKQREIDAIAEVTMKIQNYKSIPGEMIGEKSDIISALIAEIEPEKSDNEDINKARLTALDKLKKLKVDAIKEEGEEKDRIAYVQKEREDEIARKAAEDAKIKAEKDAENKIANEIELRKNAEEKAEADKKEALEEKDRAVAEEKDRIEREQKEAKDLADKKESERQKNRAHMKKINNEILDDIIKCCPSAKRDDVIDILKPIIAGKIRHVRVSV